MSKDYVLPNIAKDLGLQIRKCRRLEIVSHVLGKYLYVLLGHGNLYVKDMIDRETLYRADNTSFLNVVKHLFNVFIINSDLVCFNLYYRNY